MRRMLKALITNTKDHPFETDKINRLFNAGLDVLHVRKPHHGKQELIEFLERIDSKYHPKIVLHNHYSLIKRFNLKGIHLHHGDRDSFFFKHLYLPYLRRYAKDMTISTTIEHLESARYLAKGPINCIIFSGVFNEHTTSRLSAKLEKVNMKKILAEIKIPMFAMGGVNKETALLASHLGFSGIMMQNYIWDSKDAVQNLSLLQEEQSDSDIKQA
jgi:thiamine-phosphate pyrophosphorylase